MSEANQTQIDGTHYKQGRKGAVEHWDFTTAHNYDGLSYAATKYIHRHKNKKGVIDLEKATHYLTKLKEVTKQFGYEPRPTKQDMPGSVSFLNFSVMHEYDHLQHKAFENVDKFVQSGNTEYLDHAASYINLIIEVYYGYDQETAEATVALKQEGR